ncbi:DEAD/DEAH box helicase, partial [bacterium]|nr:DEAD/DEAH box helicase [bacterium]
MYVMGGQGNQRILPISFLPHSGKTHGSPHSVPASMARKTSTARPRSQPDIATSGGMDLFLDELAQDERFAPDLAHREILPGRAADYENLSPPLPDGLREALHAEGITRLYSHQTRGIQLVRAGKNIVAVTPTASGKTLLYSLPLFERLHREPKSRALLLFPLKALAQDQFKRLRDTAAYVNPEIRVGIYDGDTPQQARRAMRENPPHILLTNPDMLHQGILPYHGQWADFFRDLRFVVLDELHTYKGIFGSHVLQVLRRLRRVSAFYHAQPQFVATSATIDNPGALAEALSGVPFETIEENGAPSAKRHWVFVNPKLSPYTVTIRVLEEAIKAGLKTIVFTKSRRMTELIHQWTIASNPALAGRLSAYRSGYLAKERREIEQRLKSGEIDAVIATSALEMGIDIGGLDVCMLVGYPGTISTTWQRVGRVGRKGRDSAVFLVAQPDALDQYFMRHPEDFFRRNPEAAVVDGENPYLLDRHLVCAAQEVPLRGDEPFLRAPAVQKSLQRLTESGELAEAAQGQSWFANRKKPQRRVDIRGAGESVTILNTRTRRVVGTVSGFQALTECHPGAVYLHHGHTYVVEALKLGEKEAHARRDDVDYYTQVRNDKETEILETWETREVGRYRVGIGKVRVTEMVIGYERRSKQGREKISEHELDDLPPMVYETVSIWILPGPSVLAGLVEEKYHPMGSLHALEHASLAMLPLFALCDRNDLGGISYTRHPQLAEAAVFLYDGHPGGVGLANRAFKVLEELLERVYRLVSECPCEDGCPSCIHSPKCGHGNNPLDKFGAVRLLEHLTNREELKGDPVKARVDYLPGNNPLARDAEADPTSREAALAPEPPTDRSTKEKTIVPKNRLPLFEGRDIVVFDLETQLSAADVGGWHNAHLMRVSLGVLYERKTDTFRTYHEDRINELIDRLAQAELVVGFNVIRFDYAVLRGY